MYELCKISEPINGPNYYDQFCQQMQQREGFTIWNQNKLIGYCSFSDFVPGNCVMIHFALHPQHRNLTRIMLRTFANFAFIELEVPRVVTYTINTITDYLDGFLKRVGFRQEGTLVNAARLQHGIYDINLWAMLKEECKWM